MQTVSGHRIEVNRDAERIEVYTPFSLKDVCKGTPGARWQPDIKAWAYPLTPASAATLHNRMPVRVQRTPAFMALVNHAGEQRARARDLKAAVDLPPVPISKLDAWLHQRQAYWFANEKTGTMLYMGMGTGKTKVAIDLLQNQRARRVLIVCPKKVIAVWPSEFRKHCAVEYKIFALNRGSIDKRIDDASLALKQAAQIDSQAMYIFVINYEAVWRERTLKWATGIQWDYVIADESHHIKAANGVASKAMQSVGKRARKRLCLTGTPMPHSPMDAYAQYRFLDPSVYGTSYQAFKSTYAVFGGYGGHELLGYTNQDDLNQRFYSIAYHAGEDVLDLPEVMHIEREFVLEKKAADLYAGLNDDFIAWATEGGHEVTVSNALVKLLRLQQITSGFVKTDEGAEVGIDSGKAETLEEVLDEIDAGEPVVVFARFTHDLDQIYKVAAKLGRQYMEISGRFDQYAEFRESTGGEILGVQIQAGGEGLDLSRARYCVYYSLGFSLGQYDQSVKRVHRPGQTRPVTYVHLIAENTVDRKVYNALANKREVVEAILEEL